MRKERISMRKFVLKSCLNCFCSFSAAESEVKRGNGLYCGRSCSQIASVKNRIKIEHEPNVICSYCTVSFYKSPAKQTGSKSGLYFCCRNHKDLAQRIGGIKEIMPSHYGLSNGSNYRELALRHYRPVCGVCSYDKNINGLVVHHIDRNRQNNKIENLQVLCATCHLIEHNSGH